MSYKTSNMSYGILPHTSDSSISEWSPKGTSTYIIKCCFFLNKKKPNTLLWSLACLKIWICYVDLRFPEALLRPTNGIRIRRKLAQSYSILQKSLTKVKKTKQEKWVGQHHNYNKNGSKTKTLRMSVKVLSFRIICILNDIFSRSVKLWNGHKLQKSRHFNSNVHNKRPTHL